MVATVARNLRAARLNEDHRQARIVVEKPLGRDLTPGRELSCLLIGIFEQGQIFRIGGEAP